jgi:hypothetical protein
MKKTKIKIKINDKNLKKNNKTRKQHKTQIKIIKNMTPKWLNNLGKGNIMNSYSPTINQELITLNSGMNREIITNCNNENAFKMNEPLKIYVKNNKLFGSKCVPYYSKEAKNLLLSNLSANKHLTIDKIIPPKQILGNCWFNAMFAMFFISDKGRKFFHFFRQLMIEGKQRNGKLIPKKLRNAFALLNFAVDSALTGSKYAIELDTNNIILKIYNSMPSSYINTRFNLIPYVDEAGNPIVYYNAIINYLGNHSIKMLIMNNFTPVNNWEERIKREIVSKNFSHLPHIIVIEIFDGHNETMGNAGKIKNRPLSIKINNIEYSLDSAVVRDIQQQHFCAMITCEGKQMAFDGYSYHRLTYSEWKNKINSSDKWEFEGTINEDGTPLKWSFLHSYQMLMYYRVK